MKRWRQKCKLVCIIVKHIPKNYMSINISRYQNWNIKTYESIANTKVAYLSETEKNHVFVIISL